MGIHRTATAHTLIEKARALFSDRHGEIPQHDAFAPGRVNLIGDHTDYNEGLALPIAINEGIAIVGGRCERAEDRTEITSEGFGSRHLDLRDPESHEEPWVRYAAGVFHLFEQQHGSLPAFRALSISSIPAGSGLSSSAAFAIALTRFAASLTGDGIDLHETAKLCQRAEHEFAGVPCGLLDQLAILHAVPGTATLLDCRSLEATPVPIGFDQVAFFVIHSGVERRLASSVYGERLAECRAAAGSLAISSLRDLDPAFYGAVKSCLSETQASRVRHVITENSRVQGFALAMRERRWDDAGALMYASHESLKVDYEVSCPELDTIVETCRSLGSEHGFLGCRMTGGGMGGCAVALIERSSVEHARDTLNDRLAGSIGRGDSMPEMLTVT